MAYSEPPEGPNGISLCVSNAEWFDQLRGVVAGEKLKIVLEIDVKDSRSLIQTKPLPYVDSPKIEESKGKKEGKPEWSIRGQIVSMGGEEGEEGEGGDYDDDGKTLDQPADGTKARMSAIPGDKSSDSEDQ